MPELPEAEVVAGQLREGVVGAVLKGWWIGRPDIVREGLSSLSWYKNARMTTVERRGKSIIMGCTRGDETRYVVAELGMTGLLFFRSPDSRYQKHTHMVLSLEGGGESEVRYWNPRRFGRIHLLDSQELQRYTARRFGYDPLTVPWMAFRELVATRRGRLKALLMHQQRLAGIGNIYANEILYRARLHPYRRADTLRSRTVRRLFDTMRQVLIEAVEEGGSTVRDFLAPDGSMGRYQQHHRVYDRAGRPCPVGCGRTIRSLSGDRTSFYCPGCQVP